MMEDNDDFERIAGKTRTESAELRRQLESRHSQNRFQQVLGIFSNPRFLAALVLTVIAFVLFQRLR